MKILSPLVTFGWLLLLMVMLPAAMIIGGCLIEDKTAALLCGSFLSAGLITVLLLGIMRLHGVPSFSEYFAMRLPTLRQTLAALAAMFAVGSVSNLVFWLLGIPLLTEWQRVFFSDCLKTEWGTFCGLLLVIIVAPWWEELVFRGFLYRGWARGAGFVHVAGGIVIPAILWTSLHCGQYEWYYLIPIFFLGLLFGTVRWKTGSFWLCFFLHLVNNAAACGVTIYTLYNS